MSGPGSSACAIDPARPRSSGTQLEERLQIRREQRDRLLLVPALQPVQLLDRPRPGTASCTARRRCRSEGRPARPARIASTASLNEALRPSTTRSRPAEILPDRDLVVARGPRAAPRRRPPCRRRSRARATPPGTSRDRARSAIASVAPRRRAPRAARSWRPPDRASRSRPGQTYGGFETTRSNGPVQAGEELSLDELDPLRQRPCDGDSRPRQRAHPASCRSPTTRAPGARRRSRARSRPSRRRCRARCGSANPSSSSRQRSTTDSVSGRGNEHPASRPEASACRKPHSPSTYASGSRSRASRHELAEAAAPPRSSSGRSPSAYSSVLRVIRAHGPAATRRRRAATGSPPARAPRRPSARSSREVTLRARGADPRT